MATEDEEGVATEGEERELTQIEKDISEYLARLVAHIVAGTPMLPPSMRGEAGQWVWSTEGGGFISFLSALIR